MRSTSLAIVLGAAVHVAAQTPVVLTANSGPGSRHPVVALDGGVIAYVAIGNGVRDAWLVGVDGGTATRLTIGADVRVGFSNLDTWPPLSISDDGRRVAYWNAQGVHVIDRVSGTDRILAPEALLPYPQLTGDGSLVVYQAPVNGNLEVFVVASDGSSSPQQLTQNSGGGRRLPHVRDKTLVFQKLVGVHMEVFAIDLSTGVASGPLTTGSGNGNRHARLTPDATAFVYEAVGTDFLEPRRLEFGSTTPVVLASGSSGARLPVADTDDQVVVQLQGSAPEVWLADPALAPVTTGSRGGHRFPSLDRHGRVLVFQLEHAGFNEVVAVRRCWSVQTKNFGVAGTPSVGALVPFQREYRCQQTLGLHTQLPGTVGLFVVGAPQQVSLAPLGAPGNFAYVTLLAWVGVAADAQGDVTFDFPLPPALLQANVYAQFAVLDLAANPLGIVTSSGFDIAFQ